MLEVIRALEKCLSENRDCVVVTVTEAQGSTPAKTGFKMIAGKEGIIAGTVGGGGLEHFALSKCRELIKANEKFYTGVFNLNGSLNKNIKAKNSGKKGNISINSLCGGEVKLFFEVYRRNKTLHIFGGGHISQCLIKYAVNLNYFVNVYDNREEILNEIPESVSIMKHNFDLSKLPGMKENIFNIGKEDFIVTVTHNHINDLHVIEYLFKNFRDLRYVGMIGSVKKVKEATDYLKNKLNNKINLNNLYAPVGIDIGGETPAEIALSIIAEIQAVGSGKIVEHLRIKY